jgi:hypothetical protein
MPGSLSGPRRRARSTSRVPSARLVGRWPTIVRGNPIRHGWVRVEEIAPLAAAEPDLVNLWTGIPDLNDPTNELPIGAPAGSTVTHYGRLPDAVLISRPRDINRDILVPRDGVEEWECWTMRWEGGCAFTSFAEFPRCWIALPDTAPRPELADHYAEEIRAGRYSCLRALAELGDSSALPALRLALASATQPQYRGAIELAISDLEVME